MIIRRTEFHADHEKDTITISAPAGAQVIITRESPDPDCGTTIIIQRPGGQL